MSYRHTKRAVVKDEFDDRITNWCSIHGFQASRSGGGSRPVPSIAVSIVQEEKKGRWGMVETERKREKHTGQRDHLLS
jgi:hypothetical protein